MGLLGLHDFLAECSKVLIKNSGFSFGGSFWGSNYLQLGLLLVMGMAVLRGKGGVGLVWFWLGGLGNMIDKLRFGYVRDYWQIGKTNLYNNVWDWLIFLGVMVFLKRHGKDRNNI